ncbi:MAG: mannose-6-phosphate isomerase, class I, partial [Microbacterium sp.]
YAVTPGASPVTVPLGGPAIALATSGAPEVEAAASLSRSLLAPGGAVLVTPDEEGLRVAGSGELFIAQPGR